MLIFPSLHTLLSLTRQETQREVGQGGDVILFHRSRGEDQDSRRAFEKENLVTLKQHVLQEHWAASSTLGSNGAVGVSMPRFRALFPKRITCSLVIFVLVPKVLVHVHA